LISCDLRRELWTSAKTIRDTPPPLLHRGAPTHRSLVRLVGAVLADEHDERTEMRRYIGLDVLARSRMARVDRHTPSSNSTWRRLASRAR
jgi:hypothetical protein